MVKTLKTIDKDLYLSFMEKTRDELISKMQFIVSRESVKSSRETPLEDLLKEVDAIAASFTSLEKNSSTNGTCIKPMLKRMSQRNVTETYELMNDIIEKSILECPSSKIPHIVNFKKKLNEHAINDYIEIVDSIVELVA